MFRNNLRPGLGSRNDALSSPSFTVWTETSRSEAAVSESALPTTARRAKRENGGLGEDPPGSPMSNVTYSITCYCIYIRTADRDWRALIFFFPKQVGVCGLLLLKYVASTQPHLRKALKAIYVCRRSNGLIVAFIATFSNKYGRKFII
jgi:hypothetical protein